MQTFRPDRKVMLLLTVILWATTGPAHSQETTLTLDQTIRYALQNNPRLTTSDIRILQQQALKRTAVDLPKTEVSMLYGQYNSYVSNDQNFTISQSVPFPTTWVRRSNLARERITQSEVERRVTEAEIVFAVTESFVTLSFLREKETLLMRSDSLLQELRKTATLRFETGETALVEKIAAETRWQEVLYEIQQNRTEQEITKDRLIWLMGGVDSVHFSGKLDGLTIPPDDGGSNALLMRYDQQMRVAEAEKKVAAAQVFPDIRLGFFSQTLIGFQNVNGQEQYFDSSDRFTGFEVGLTLPLWIFPHSARLKAARYDVQVAENEQTVFAAQLAMEKEKTLKDLEKSRAGLDYYNTYALTNADRLIHQSRLAYQAGETDYVAHLLALTQVISIHEGYLNTLRDHLLNQARWNYLTGRTDRY